MLPSNDIENRKKLLEIYRQRGNSEDLINDVVYYFDNWSRNQNDYNYPIVILQKDKYLEDLLKNMGLIILKEITNVKKDKSVEKWKNK